MNKEECVKALAFLEKYSNREDYGCIEWNDSTNEELIKALITIDKLIIEHFELVKHTTPKKVVWIYDDEPLCPSCSEAIDAGNQDLCEFCGQRLDWSEDDE